MNSCKRMVGIVEFPCAMVHHFLLFWDGCSSYNCLSYLRFDELTVDGRNPAWDV